MGGGVKKRSEVGIYFFLGRFFGGVLVFLFFLIEFLFSFFLDHFLGRVLVF